MLREVNLGGVHTQSAGYFMRRLAKDDVEVVDLVMLRPHLAFDAGQSRLQHLSLPFLLPNAIQLRRWVWHPVNCCGASILLGLASQGGEMMLLTGLCATFGELVEDAPA